MQIISQGGMSVASTLVSLGSQQKSSAIASHTTGAASDPAKHDPKARRNSRPIGVVKPQQQQHNTPSPALQQPPLHNTSQQQPLHTSPQQTPLHSNKKDPSCNVNENSSVATKTVDVACGTDSINSRHQGEEDNCNNLSSTNNTSNTNSSCNSTTKVPKCDDDEESITNSNTPNPGSVSPKSTPLYPPAGRNSVIASHSNGDLQKKEGADECRALSASESGQEAKRVDSPTHPSKVSMSGAPVATCV